MITAVLTPHPAIASAFAAQLDLSKLPNAFGAVTEVYRKGNFVVAVSKDPAAIVAVREEYGPERLYYASFGDSVTSERFTGDVVLPNAFVPYSKTEEAEEEASFLENYENQEDYDFETFGLSIGGVCVSTELPIDDDLLLDIASEYGADVVDKDGCSVVTQGTESDEFVLYPIYGVTGGIVGNGEERISEAVVAKNMAAVFRFLEETFSDETGEEEDVGTEDNDSVTGDGDE
ncbi:MAG: hypothetical protein QG650_899 [Patescibacteria group bacterium]|nr:hypothetical protein [Patescibacteria group bacterium]